MKIKYLLPLPWLMCAFGLFAQQTLVIDNGGLFIMDGDVKVVVEGGLNLSTFSEIKINGGTLSLDAGSALTNDGVITNNSTISNSGNNDGLGTYQGNGAYNGSLYVNSADGTVSPGLSPGCLTFQNSFTNLGFVQLEIDGTATPCSDFDQIVVNGTATLGGTLFAAINYTPTAGDLVTIIDATSLSGTFDDVSSLPPDWEIFYDYPTAGKVSLGFMFCPNVIGNLVYQDANRNGVFDAGDAGINEVLLNLYADDGDGVLDAGDGMPIATTTTANVLGQDGSYTFNVCEGSYIIEVAASNFLVGGALYNSANPLVSSPISGAPDPDSDNTDNDDNGDQVIGFGVATAAFTVSSNNNNIDFGFKTPAQISISDLMMAEGSPSGTTNFMFTVSRSVSETEDAITLTVNTADVTAAAGTDYTAIAGGSVTLNSGESSTTVTVSVNQDAIVEADETFMVNLFGAPSHAMLLDGSAVGTILNDDNATITLSGGGMINEGNAGTTNRSFTATFSGEVQGGFSVDYQSSDLSATLADNDYAGASGTLVFGGTNGEEHSFTVTIIGDTKVELDETFITSLLGVIGPAGISTADSPQTTTIVNDDAAIVSINSVSQAESVTPQAFTVSLSNAVDANVTMSFATSDGTAETSDSDYSNTSTTVTFLAGSTSGQTVNVPVSNDNKVEADEVFNMTLGSLNSNGRNVTFSGGGATLASTGTILNDDSATLTLSGGGSSFEGNSGSSAKTFTATLNNPVQAGFSIAFNTNDGTATVANNDYQDNDGTLTFSGTENEMHSFPVNVVGDQSVELDETFTAELGAISGTSLGSSIFIAGSPQTYTITNDDQEISVAVSPGSVLEDGSTNLEYTFTRTGYAVDSVTVFFSVGGTATFTNDYAQSGATLFNATSGWIHFTFNQTSKVITINPETDMTTEADETVVLNITPHSRYNVGSPNSATGTIEDDDNNVSVMVAPVSTAEDGSTNLVYTFTRTDVNSGALVVNFSVGGTADLASDYTQTGATTFTSTTGSVTFSGVSPTATVTIDPTADLMVEADETVVLTVLGGIDYTIDSPSVATGTIDNDDAEVTVAVSPSSVNEDGATNLEYTFTRTGYTGSLLNIGFNVGGTATFGTDYSHIGASTFSTTAGTVAMAANSTTASVIIDPTADFLVENNEMVILTVVSGTGYNAGTPNSATGTINNDEIDFGDAPDTYSTLLASNGARHTTVFGVQLGSSIDGENDGQPNADGTGDDVDAEGDDDDGVTLPAALIAATTANITVNASMPGFLNAWVDFNGNNNFADAGEQVFTDQALTSGDNALSISMPSTVYQGLSFARFRFNTTGALSYNGLAADGEVEDYQIQLINTQFTINDTMVVEGNAGTTNLVFTVTRSNNASACSIDYAITGGAASPLGVGGMGGADYQALALGTLNFTAGGATSAPVIVTVNSDQTVELNETVVVTLSNPVSANILDGEGTGTITNDDAATITISSPSIAEGDNGNSTLTFDIAMSNPSDANVSFNFGTTDGTATAANSDYIGIGGSHTLAPGEQNKQVFQAVVGDCIIEPDEAFSVVLSSLSNSGRNVSFSGGGATLGGTGNILNDDALPVITCSNDFSQNTDAGVCQATVTLPQPDTSSVCGSSTLEFRYRPVNAANQPNGPYSNYAPAASNTVVFQKGKYEIEWRITDGSGSSVCSHFLTVVDNEAPVAVCKNITVQLSTSGTVVITPAQVDNGSSDNCAFTLSLNTTTFSCANVGPNMVTLTATDPGNLIHSCNATVTVEDNVAPVALCKNVTVQLDSNGDGSITASQMNNGSSDACGIQSLSVTPYIFTCANVGANTVTLTVTDVNNNSASCNATVTVEDKVKPVALCQNLTITLNADGTKTVTPSQINNGSSDACGIAGMSLFPNVFSCNNIGVNNTTLTVTDVNGNSNTCTATVTVNEFVVITNVTTTPESCTGNGDGTITIEATTLGGVLQYSINGGASYSFSNVFTGLTPGTYNVKVRAQGTANCGDTATATVGTASGGAQTWYKDWDNDGYSDGTTQVSCTQPNGYKLPANLSATSGDCNDNDPSQFPGQTWYKDGDNDGYSDGTVLISCTKPAGYKSATQLTQTSGDCNDSNTAIRPGATETCNGVDDNCNSQIDEGLADLVYNGNVVLTTQAQVNAFSQCYTVINGNLTIQNAGVSNINTLSNIHKVTGHVLIKQTSLTSLAGLSSLDTVGGNLTINNNIYGSKLGTLDGLENLARVGGNLAIFSNLKLSDCCAIHDLLNTPGAIGGNTSIYSNLTGCESVSGINTSCGAPNSLVGPININLWVDILFDKQGSSGVYSMYDADEDQINMTIKGQFSTGVAKLFDQNDRMVLRQNFQPGNTWFRMMLGQTVPGSYQLEISLDGNVYTKALVIE